MVTVGVSLAIPEPWGPLLQEARRSFGDPMADAIPPHITLLPPTEVDNGDFAGLHDHLADVSRGTSPFPVLLRGTGTFRPVSPVVFVQLARGISDCEQLQYAIRRGPVRRPLEFHYHPHVTVAHRLDDVVLDHAFDELSEFRADFVVERVHLYEHGDDGVWRAVEAFPLAD